MRWITRCCTLMGALALGCANPAGDRLTEAEALQAAGDLAGAAAAYDGIAAEWPDSEEAKLARLHAPLVHRELLTQRVANKSWLEAADQASAILAGDWASTLEPDIARLRADNAAFDTTLVWTTSGEREPLDRAALALQLARSPDHDWLRPATTAWLQDHIGEAFGPLCMGKLETLDTIDDLEDLAGVSEVCALIVEYAPDTEPASAAQAAIDGPLAERVTAIQSSPAYRTEAALAGCRAWNAWLRSERSAIRSLARAGKIEAAENRAYRFQDQVEDRADTQITPHIEYLRNRLESLQSRESQIALMRQISRDCEG